MSAVPALPPTPTIAPPRVFDPDRPDGHPEVDAPGRPDDADSPVDRVRAVLRAEADAILRAADRARPEAVGRAVALLAGCRGKVVVSGVGKSGIVGRKVAATLTSTGTPAVFLHPADAPHGDLGVVQPGDLGLLVSHGGESPEVVALLPHFRGRGVPVIALVGRSASTLARAAAVALDTGVDREACPLNLAPTASTAAALAVGDGLAMAAMTARRFTAADFARNHPAGRLGKRLTLTARDLMHEPPAAAAVGPDAGWAEVVDALCRAGLGAVAVTAADGSLAGLVTDGDVRRAVRRTPPAALAGLTAAAMMTRTPVTVGPAVPAVDALQLMEDRPSQISVLPVVDPPSGRWVGLLRLHDIVRSGLV